MSVNKLIDDMNSYANHVISFGDGCVNGKHTHTHTHNILSLSY
jgi:hypothetical protein